MTTDVTIFFSRAREFCSFVEEADKLPLPERTFTARARLSALYTAAVLLPSVLESDAASPEPPPLPASAMTGFDDRDIYWHTADPHTLAEPGAGSLTDEPGATYAGA